MYLTDHFRKHFHTLAWPDGPGLSEDACRWLGEQGIIAFGVETMAPGVKRKNNRRVHEICSEMKFTHYENIINLHLLASKDIF
ncbi:MAG: kynurenine formamidase [Cyclobacteriaceae bacterium]|jgi:kynurenine formamidase